MINHCVREAPYFSSVVYKQTSPWQRSVKFSQCAGYTQAPNWPKATKNHLENNVAFIIPNTTTRILRLYRAENSPRNFIDSPTVSKYINIDPLLVDGMTCCFSIIFPLFYVFFLNATAHVCDMVVFLTNKGVHGRNQNPQLLLFFCNHTSIKNQSQKKNKKVFFQTMSKWSAAKVGIKKVTKPFIHSWPNPNYQLKLYFSWRQGHEFCSWKHDMQLERHGTEMCII